MAAPNKDHETDVLYFLVNDTIPVSVITPDTSRVIQALPKDVPGNSIATIARITGLSRTRVNAALSKLSTTDVLDYRERT